jgi:hypothetical protein
VQSSSIPNAPQVEKYTNSIKGGMGTHTVVYAQWIAMDLQRIIIHPLRGMKY